MTLELGLADPGVLGVLGVLGTFGVLGGLEVPGVTGAPGASEAWSDALLLVKLDGLAGGGVKGRDCT